MASRRQGAAISCKSQYISKLIAVLCNILICSQPFIDKSRKVFSLLNGEIYNYRDFLPDASSDGYCILPVYQQHGVNMSQHFDGEFAIVVVDFSKNTLLYSTDVFAVKPLWFCVNDEKKTFGISTFRV